MNKKKRIYIDLDNTMCDFQSAYDKGLFENPSQKYPQSQWGFYIGLKPLHGAVEAFKKLSEVYDVWILTRPSFKNIICYSEKAYWVLNTLGYEAQCRLILCGNKSLVKGEYLIDDQGGFGQEEFDGEWIKFGSKEFPNWDVVLKYLL